MSNLEVLLIGVYVPKSLKLNFHFFVLVILSTIV